MAATRQQRTDDDDAQPRAEDMIGGVEPPVPDEDGPHDVPDEKVIEQTLPELPARDRESRPR